MNCMVTNVSWPRFKFSEGGKGGVKVLHVSVCAALGWEANKALMQTGALNNFKNSFFNTAVCLLCLQQTFAGSGWLCGAAGRLCPCMEDDDVLGGSEPGPAALRLHPMAARGWGFPEHGPCNPFVFFPYLCESCCPHLPYKHPPLSWNLPISPAFPG